MVYHYDALNVDYEKKCRFRLQQNTAKKEDLKKTGKYKNFFKCIGQSIQAVVLFLHPIKYSDENLVLNHFSL